MSEPVPFQPTDEQQQALEAFCRKWEIADLSLFGSLARGDARPDSDADVMVTLGQREVRRYTMSDLFDMEDELVAIFERPVDLLTRKGVLGSRNPIRRASILRSMRRLIPSS